MAGWREQLRDASFRGASFFVDSDEATFGRRSVLHEYLQRDIPFSEDLGRATRRKSVTAFVIGADYMSLRDKLIKALEEIGPGTLVHPYFGECEVVVSGDVTVSQSRKEGGMARFQIEFVEASEQKYPTEAANSRSQVLGRADAVDGGLLGDFGRDFQVAGWPDFLSTSAVGDITGWLSGAEGLLSLAGGFSFESLLGDPLALGSALLGLIGQSRGRGYENAMALSSTRPAPRPGPYRTTVRQQEARNTAALGNLIVGGALTQAARDATDRDWPVYDDAVRVRDDVTTALDREAERATSDRTYQALSDLRLSVAADMTERAAQSPRLRTITPPELLPSLVVAYDLYEDAGRADEIAIRNRVRHPGFVPIQPLMVLSR